MTYQVDTRMDLMLDGLPAATARLARSLRQAVLEQVPECREIYYGGQRVGIASYKQGENGAPCCRLQARNGEVRLFFSAAECLGPEGGHILVPADSEPDWARLEQALTETIRHTRNWSQPKLAS